MLVANDRCLFKNLEYDLSVTSQTLPWGMAVAAVDCQHNIVLGLRVCRGVGSLRLGL